MNKFKVFPVQKQQESGAVLGSIARIYSPPSSEAPSPPKKLLPDRQLHAFKFALQSEARRLLPDERVSHCLRLPYSSDGVDLCYSDQFKKAHYRGLQTCGSVWHCPICASRIAGQRRDEIAKAMDGCTACGGSVAMVTYTLAHGMGDDLGAVSGLLLDAHSKAKQGKWWQAFKADVGYLGTIRGLELTYGQHGFHPHLHELWFFDHQWDKHAFLQDFAGLWSIRYKSFVRRRGGRVSDHAVNFDMDMSSDDYLAKTGAWDFSDELARSVVKKAKGEAGRSMPQLLVDALAGDEEAGRVWKVYAKAFKGKRQLYWSQGLKARYSVAESDDRDIAARDLDERSIVLANLPWSEWKTVLQMDRRGELLDMVEAMDFKTVRELWAYMGVQFEGVQRGA